MNDLSLYIHIPFCKTICLYCNFLTFAHKNKWIPQYVDALITEIVKRSPNYKNRTIETIFFGGGTPSLIEPEYIQKILETIRKNYQLKKNPEISIECNPESVDEKRLKIYKAAGVNRISLGIQSFNKKTLFRVARPHNEKAIFKALKTIQNACIQNFGADFIIGLPYQTLQSFEQELKTILSYKPPHLSFYFLSYDTKKIDIFSADCPPEEEQIAIYHSLNKTLKNKDYRHYEVSNYALPGFECQHNLRYWQQKDYLGLGLGAHSIVNGLGYENEKNFEAYLQNPLAIYPIVQIDKELERLEYIMLRLRTAEGINKREYQKRFKNYNFLEKKAESYIETEHLIKDKTGLRANEKGFLIIDYITKNLL